MSELEQNKVHYKLSSRSDSRWHEHEQETKDKITSESGVKHVSSSVGPHQDPKKAQPHNQKQNSLSSPSELYRRNSRWDVPPTQHERDCKLMPNLKQPASPYQSRLNKHKSSYDPKKLYLETRQNCSEGTVNFLEIDTGSDDNNNHNSDSNNNNDDVNDRNNYNLNYEGDVNHESEVRGGELDGNRYREAAEKKGAALSPHSKYFRSLIHTADSSSSLIGSDIAERFASISSEICKGDSPGSKISDSVHNARLKENMLAEVDFDIEHYPGVNAQELVKSKDLNIKLVKRSKHDQRMEREKCRRLEWSRFVQPKVTDCDEDVFSILQQDPQPLLNLTSNEIVTSSCTGAKTTLKRKSDDIVEDMRTLIESRREKRAHHEISQQKKYHESRGYSSDKEKTEIGLKTSQAHGECQENAQSRIKQACKELSKRASDQECLQKLFGQTETNQKLLEGLSCKVKYERDFDSNLVYLSKMNHLMVAAEAFEVGSNCKEKNANTSETESLTSSVASDKSFPSNEEALAKLSDIQEENMTDGHDFHRKESVRMDEGREASAVHEAVPVEFIAVGNGRNSAEQAVPSSSSKQGMEYHQNDCDQREAKQTIVSSVTKAAVICKPRDSGAMEISGKIVKSEDRLTEAEDKNSNAEEVTSEDNGNGLDLEPDIIFIEEKIVDRTCRQVKKNPSIDSDEISVLFEHLVCKPVIPPWLRKCQNCFHEHVRTKYKKAPKKKLIKAVENFKVSSKSNRLPKKPECSTQENVSGSDELIVKKRDFSDVLVQNRNGRGLSLSSHAKERRKMKSHEDINSTFSGMEKGDVCIALDQTKFTDQTVQSTHQDKTDGKNSQSCKLSNFPDKETEQISSTSSCFSEKADHLDGRKINDNEKISKQGRNSDGNVRALKVSIEKHRLVSRKSHEVLMGKVDSCSNEKPTIVLDKDEQNHCITEAESFTPISDPLLGSGSFTKDIPSVSYNHQSTCAINLGNSRERKELTTCFGSKSLSEPLSGNALNCYSVTGEAKTVAHVCHTNQLADPSNCNLNINDNSDGNNKEIHLLIPSDGVLTAAVSTRTHISIQRELECNEILVKSCVVHDKNVAHSGKEPHDGHLIKEQNSNILPGGINLKSTSNEVFVGVTVSSSVKKSGQEVLNDLGAINNKGCLKQETLTIVSSDSNSDNNRTKGVETGMCKDLCEIQTESDLQQSSTNCKDEVLLRMNILEATTKIEEKSCKIDNFKHQHESGVNETMQNLGNQGKVLEMASPCIEANKIADKKITKLDLTNCEQNLINSAESTSRTYTENDEECNFKSEMCATYSKEPHLPCKNGVSNKIDLESDPKTFRNKESLQEESSGNLGSLLLVRQYGDECEHVEDNQFKCEENMESDKDCEKFKQKVLNCYSEQPSKQGNLTDNESCQAFQQNCNIDSDVPFESHVAKSDHDLWMNYENRSNKQPSNHFSKYSKNRNVESIDHIPFNCEHGILSHNRKCCCSTKHQFSISHSGGIESEQETSGLKVKPHCDHSLCPSVSDDEHCSNLTGRKHISTSSEQRKHDYGKCVYLEEQHSGTIGRCLDMHQVERDHSACCCKQERRRLSYDSREDPFATLPKRKRRRSLLSEFDSALVQKSLTQAMVRLHAGSDFDVPCKQCGKFARHHVDGKCVFRPRNLSKKCREYWDPDCFKKPNVIPDEAPVEEKNANDVFISEGDGNMLEDSVVKLASSNLGLEDIEALDKIVEECGITLYEPRPNPPTQVVLPIDSTTKLVCTQTNVEQVPHSLAEKIQDQYSTGYKVFPSRISQNNHTCDLAPIRDPRLKKLASSDAFRGGSILSTSSAVSSVSNANYLACAYDPEHPITSSPERIVTERIASNQKSQASSSSKISKTKRKLILPNELDASLIKSCDLDCSLTYLKSAQSFQHFQKPPRTPSPPYPSSPPSPLSSMSPISPQSYPSPLSSLSSIPPPPTPPNLSLELCIVSQPERRQSKPPLPIPAQPNLSRTLCTVTQPERYQSNLPLHPLLPTPNLNHELCTVTQSERQQSDPLPPLPLTTPNLSRELCTIALQEMHLPNPPLPPLPPTPNLSHESCTVMQPERHESNPSLPPLPPMPLKSSFESCTVTRPPLPPPYPPPSQIPLPPLPPTPKTPCSRSPFSSHYLFHGYDSSGNRGVPISSEECDWSQTISNRYVGNNQSSHLEPCAYNWHNPQSHSFTQSNPTSQSFLPSGDNAQGLSGTPYNWSYTSSVLCSSTTWPLQTQNANAIPHQQMNEQSHRWQYGSRTVPSFQHTARPPQPPAPGEA